MKKVISLIVLVCFCISCSSTTQIVSNDSKAKIYVDGEYVGTGSVSYTDKKTLFSSTKVTLKKKGCKPKDFVMSKSEEFQVGPCIGGLFVLVPFLWVMGYKATHNYEFECQRM